MRRLLIVFAAIFGTSLLQVAGSAQQDRLPGRWEGKVSSAQGERPANATFKKEGDTYTGTISGMRGDVPFKEVKVDGDKVTAKAEIETPQGNIAVNYKFTLQGDSLKGEGEVDFGGQTFSFTYDLKRAGEKAATPTTTGEGQSETARQQPRPQQIPQPQQKPSLDYFTGQWTFKYLGRESALAPAPREGTVVFTKSADGRSLEGRIMGKSEAGPYQESVVITFDEATKMLTFAERLASGARIQSKGDWSSPISIRFTVEPIKFKGQTLQLRRTISVISAYSFSLVEELSEDGGPFVRLGQAVYTKLGASPAKN